MTERSAERTLERRRVQNREAQRRFREKKTLQKTLNSLRTHGHPYGALESLLQSPPPSDSLISFPSCQFPRAATASVPRSTRIWDSAASDVLVPGEASLFGYSNTPDDAASPLPDVPPQYFSTTTLGPLDDSRGIPTPASSVGTSVDRSSSLAETSLSPRKVGSESPDEIPLNPTSMPSMKSAGGWLSPLHLAAKRGSSRIIRMLLQHNSDCNEPDSEGLTPLIHAVMGGHEEAALSLLEYGARIENIQRDGERPRPSAIHWAVLKRREGVLRVLLDHSSDPKLLDSYDDCGRAPLHIAIDAEFDAGVSLLLKFGADPSQKVQQ
ncbi:putative ankyrin repeat-containing protein [Rosellinia necatrix]|uniref:Putative ankyrin repeat-containing protein n=1 Tax=Rosellinia necatrix TaxID=77044 RepID=A0A1W2TTS6_ROSNE|nr:putative ankyrin repeat-containing protein [Rosellinia necatrix]